MIASQSDLVSLLRSQLHIHTESTLLLQRRLHLCPCCQRTRRHGRRGERDHCPLLASTQMQDASTRSRHHRGGPCRDTTAVATTSPIVATLVGTFI